MTIEELILYLVWFTVAVMGQAIVVVILVWLLHKKQVWPLIMFAIRGGSLVLKGHLSNEIEIICSRKPITNVSWKVRDKASGKMKVIYQPIKKVWHTLKGTSYPIHFCPFSNTTNISINAKESSQLNTEEINSLMAMEYTQGRSDATAFRTIGGFPIDKATLLMLLVVGIAVVAVLAMQFQVLGIVSPPT